MPFKETKEGQTHYCVACESEARFGQRSERKHTCGMTPNTTKEMLFDFWKEYTRAKISGGDRDIIIEKYTDKFDQVISETRQETIAQLVEKIRIGINGFENDEEFVKVKTIKQILAELN